MEIRRQSRTRLTAATLAAGGLLGPLLFDVSARDPLVIAGAVGALVMASLLACAPPCARASRIDPIEALQAE